MDELVRISIVDQQGKGSIGGEYVLVRLRFMAGRAKAMMRVSSYNLARSYAKSTRLFDPPKCRAVN